MGKNRRNLTITIVASIIAVVAIVTGAFALGRNRDTSVQPSIEIGSRIDKSLGKGRKLLNASVWDGTTSTWTNGTGTKADPYLIESAANLAHILSTLSSSKTYSGVYFKQTVDIDLNGIKWYSRNATFEGNYDGNNLSIFNYVPYGSYGVGLFNKVSGSTIANIKLFYHPNKTVSLNSYCIGSISSYTTSSTIINCHVEGMDIINNYSTTSPYNDSIGGLCGTIGSGSTISGCSVNNAKIRHINGSDKIGGLVGGCGGTIVNCKATNITIKDENLTYGRYIGGLCGYLEAGSKIDNIVMENIVIDDISEAEITYIGGCYGRVDEDSDTSSSITNIIIRDLVIKLSANGENFYVGGVAGQLYYGEPYLSDIFIISSQVSVAGTGTLIYVGGICGQAGNSSSYTISRCYVDIDIDVDITLSGTNGKAYTGGIVGYSNDSTTSKIATILNCCFAGNLNGSGYVGGVFGSCEKYNIVQNVVISGIISGGDHIGGFAGYASGQSNSSGYSAKYSQIVINGEIISSADAAYGILHGSTNSLSSYCSNIYFNFDKIPLSAQSGTTAKTSTALKTRSTYDAWTDFDTYWVLDENINNGFPVLEFCLDLAKVTDFDGDGSAENPYIIEDVQGLVTFAEWNNSKVVPVSQYWKIADGVSELDLSSVGSWTPVGYRKDNQFYGHLDGNKCKITGLNIDNNYTYVGLFGYVARGASIEWLSVNGTVAYDSAKYVGGLAGYVDKGAIVSDCYFEGNITGYMNSNIEQKVGSLVGYSVNNDVETSYASATHTRYYAHKTSQGKLAQVYVLGANPEVVGNVTTETLQDLGFDLDQWVGLADIPTANFSITRNTPNYGTIYAEANVGGVVETVTFTDNISDNQYKKGTEILVEATAASGYAIKSLTIDGMEYSNAINKPSILISYNTANTGKVLHIEAQFAKQYTLTLNNGTNYNLGTETVTGSYIPASAPYTVLTGTHVTVTATAKEKANNDTYKAFITSIVIDGETILLDSIDNETVKSVNGKSYTIRLVKTTTGFKTEKVTSVTISYVQTSNNTITINYGAEQEVLTSLTIVDGVGGISSPEKYEDSFVTEWGSTIPTQTKTTDTEITENYTFIGWAVDGQIVSGEETFTTEVGSNTTVTQLWAKLYNVTITLPEGETSVRLSHKLTGLMYNLTEGTQELMAGEWIVSVPTGRTLKVNGVVQTRVNGIYTVRFTADTTIEIV